MKDRRIYMEETSDRIQWHTGFYGAAELELREDRDVLEFIQEHSLTKKPLLRWNAKTYKTF
jgi:hypothetical protein